MSWKLYEGDCFDHLPLIEDKSVDMILCDLPYGTTACKWDTPLPLDDLWYEYKRVIKDNGAIVLTASQPFTTKLISSNYEMFRYELIWDKVAISNPFLSNKMPLKCHENVLIFYSALPTYNPIKWKGRYWHRGGNLKPYNKSLDVVVDKSLSVESEMKFPKSIIKLSNADNTNIMHPTQKPVALFEYLIKTYTNEGELVLDNCAGSGTTGVACENLNRNSILMEQEPDYCQIIKDRMATAHELQLEQRKQTSLQAFKGQQTLISPAK